MKKSNAAYSDSEMKENKCLVNEIIELYENARKTVYSKSNPRVIRSRSHVISSQVEDLFADFFSRFTQMDIIIDRPISISFKSSKKTFYPDIVIRNEKSFIRFFDIKLDLGWKRNDFEKYCIEKAELIKEAREQKADLWKEKLSIDKDIKYEIVVVSSKNIGKEYFENINQIIENNNLENEIDLYFLTEDVHPNENDKERIKATIKINHSEFTRLRNRIKSVKNIT